MMHPNMSYVLWIATVGGAPPPLIESLLYWKPERAIFLPSEQTESQIESSILPETEKRGFHLSPGQYEVLLLSDAQDPTACVKAMVEYLQSRVQAWLGRGEGYGIVIDWTGGTKTMSAALALVSHKWNNTHFSYVGGEERTNQGVGIVKSGSESVRTCVNSWEVLGYRVLEDAIAAYNHGAFRAGMEMLASALRQISRENQILKSEISTLRKLMEGVDAWDKCQYKEAKGHYEHCHKRFNDLRAILSRRSISELGTHINVALKDLDMLMEAQRTDIRQGTHARKVLCKDMLANAGRRKEEGRHVDAIARLYHAIEVLGQVQLEAKGGIDASQASVNSLPVSLREKWQPRADENGCVKLGLQAVYETLIALDDPLGRRFQNLKWDAPDSPLSRRNRSIAGHGFEPVNPKDCDRLWKGALQLAEWKEDSLGRFPTLAPFS